MCIVVYEYCNICRCNERTVYRCILKLQMHTDPPCNIIGNLQPPSLYVDRFICMYCFATGMPHHSLTAHMIKMSMRHIEFTKILVHLNQGEGWMCTIE